MSKWIKKGDTVKVISGNDKGKVGEVIKRDADRILVRGVNVRSRHLKRRSEEQPGQIVKTERPVHISNVAFCVEGNVKKLFIREHDGKKELLYKQADKEVVHRVIKSS